MFLPFFDEQNSFTNYDMLIGRTAGWDSWEYCRVRYALSLGHLEHLHSKMSSYSILSPQKSLYQLYNTILKYIQHSNFYFYLQYIKIILKNLSLFSLLSSLFIFVLLLSIFLSFSSTHHQPKPMNITHGHPKITTTTTTLTTATTSVTNSPPSGKKEKEKEKEKEKNTMVIPIPIANLSFSLNL